MKEMMPFTMIEGLIYLNTAAIGAILYVMIKGIVSKTFFGVFYGTKIKVEDLLKYGIIHILLEPDTSKEIMIENRRRFITWSILFIILFIGSILRLAFIVHDPWVALPGRLLEIAQYLIGYFFITRDSIKKWHLYAWTLVTTGQAIQTGAYIGCNMYIDAVFFLVIYIMSNLSYNMIRRAYFAQVQAKAFKDRYRQTIDNYFD